MNCPLRTQATDQLLDYSAGRLTAPARLALEQHMEACADCASFRIEQAAVWEALDLWEPVAVSLDFNRNLWRRIDAAEAKPWYRKLADSSRLANWRPVLPLTAAVALIAAGFLLDHPGAGVPKAGFTVNEAEQVEQTLDDIQLLHQFDLAPAGNNLPSDASPKTM
jgi:anti-sigma factor RsiW